jgi:signal transduction histidine kinase/ligand-binding sensor domain-containing protein
MRLVCPSPRTLACLGRPLLRLALAAVCAAYASDATVASPRFRFDHWTTEHGLPQNTVNEILQTRDGYLWFTTFDGLVRYDGIRFVVFNKANSEGIATNRFTQLCEDADGALWITADTDVLTRYANGRFESFAGHGIPVIGANIRPDGDLGVLIYANDRVGHWRDGRFVEGAAPTSNGLFVDYSARSGTQWLADRAGLHGIRDGGVTSFPMQFDPNFIFNVRLYEDRSGALWIGTTDRRLAVLRNGVVTYFGEKEGFPKDLVAGMVEDRNGVLWCATQHKGLVRVADGAITVYTKADGLPDDQLLSIYEDREGTLWVGTYDHGLVACRPQLFTTYSTRDGLAEDHVYPLCEDTEGGLWIGTLGGVSRFLDGRFRNLTARDGLKHIYMSGLYDDPGGGVWMGSLGGLVLYRNGRFEDFSDALGLGSTGFDVYSILRDRAGDLWFGTNLGLVRFRGSARTLFTTADGLPSNDVKALLEDRNGTLWIGTYGGVARRDSERFTALTMKDGLTSNTVRALHEDGDGALWIGTYDGGISRLKDGRFTNYTSAVGLYNDGAFAIVEDGRGNFWMSCNRGVYRTTKQQLDDFAEGRIAWITCIGYGIQDGMLKSECNGGRQYGGVRTRDGRLWFATQEGVIVIDPATLVPNSQPPPVVIEGVTLNRAALDLADGARIGSGAGNFEIIYSGLSFIKPEQVRFRYRLEGLDSDWVDAGPRRAAFYPYLPPGEYVFRVVAANSDGVWNEAGASLRVVVTPPFWRSWWFSALVTAAVVGILFVAYRVRVAQLERAKATQEEYSRRFIELQEHDRKRIAGELHDSLSQSLVIIKNRALHGLEERDDDENAFEQLEEISDAATHALGEVRQIAYDLRPFQIDRLGLTSAIEAMVKKTAGASNLHATTDLDDIDGLLPPEREIDFYRIVQESLNNVVKHARATEVRVTIRRENGAIDVTIRDNGAGFVPEKTLVEVGKGGFGLMGMTERARILDATIDVDSALGRGTNVRARVRIKEVNNGR